MRTPFGVVGRRLPRLLGSVLILSALFIGLLPVMAFAVQPPTDTYCDCDPLYQHQQRTREERQHQEWRFATRTPLYGSKEIKAVRGYEFVDGGQVVVNGEVVSGHWVSDGQNWNRIPDSIINIVWGQGGVPNQYLNPSVDPDNPPSTNAEYNAIWRNGDNVSLTSYGGPSASVRYVAYKVTTTEGHTEWGPWSAWSTTDPGPGTATMKVESRWVTTYGDWSGWTNVGEPFADYDGPTGGDSIEQVDDLTQTRVVKVEDPDCKPQSSTDCLPPGHCPAGFDKFELPDGRVNGKAFTADVDYQAVILVGGPPNSNNQDPDGRNKYFHNVKAGESVSRVAHDISHVCFIVATTTTSTQPSTTSTQPSTTTSQPTTTSTEATTTTTVEETTTTTVEETTTTTVEETTTTTVEETTTSTEDDPEVLPTVVTTTPDEVDDEELPFTGIDAGVMLAIAAVLLGLGAALLTMTRRLEDES